MLLVLRGYLCVFGVSFLGHLNGLLLGNICAVYVCQHGFSPFLCKLPQNGFQHPCQSNNSACLPVNLGLEVVQLGVPIDNVWLPKVHNKECLHLVLLSLVDLKLNKLLNDSSFVFHPIHIIDLLWSWEKHCLDLEFLHKSLIYEVFHCSTVNKSFLFSCSM
jgi:hypothetical protein